MNKLRELRLSKNIPAKEMVAVVQRLYPKFDKTQLSKCESDEYGSELPEDAMQALYAVFEPERLAPKKRRRSGRNRLTYRISARLEDDTYRELQQRIRTDGYETMQSWLSDVVQHYLKERESDV